MTSTFTSKEVKKSKVEALEVIKKYLDASDVESQFDDKSGDYYSKEKFIVTWNANWKGIPSEFSLDKTDSFYKSYSGYACIFATRSFFHEKQLGAYPTIERGLIEVGLKLCPKKDKMAFFEKYAIPYNSKVKK